MKPAKLICCGLLHCHGNLFLLNIKILLMVVHQHLTAELTNGDDKLASILQGKYKDEVYKRTYWQTGTGTGTLTPLTVSRAQTIILMYSSEELVSPAGEQPLAINMYFIYLFLMRLTW